ncbi:Cation/hydrogen exchanger family protein [Euphorbia peplus]|nr:Cation/hydrogen exchanger family protein [Euphorbia peplus]
MDIEEFSMGFPGTNTTMTCLVLPERINSHGMFDGNTHFLTYSLPLLELQIGIILTLGYLIWFFLKPFGISSFVSSMLAGIVLGPNGLGKLKIMRDVIFPHDSQDIIYTATTLGYYLFNFLAAVQIEFGMVLKAGYKALSIGITITLLPFIASNLYNYVFNTGSGQLDGIENFVVSIAIMTSLPVVASVIDQLKLANTELGRHALTSGLVADVGGIGLFVVRMFMQTRSLEGTMGFLLPVLIFLLALAFLFRPAVDRVVRNTPEGKHLSTSFIYGIVAFALATQVLFTVIGQNFVLAPFLVGLAVPCGAPLGSALLDKFGAFTNGMLMNILISTSLMRADLYLFITHLANFKRSLFILLASFLIKMLGCVAPSILLKIPITDGIALGFILTYTGVIHLYSTAIYRDIGYFTEETYAFLTFYMLLNATIFPIIIKKLYNPSKRYDTNNTRSLLSLKPHSELKILTCIYGQDNADSQIKLLDTLRPTKESPFGIYALHLVELIGRYVPILVSHSKLKTITTKTSQKIVYDFNHYEKNNWDSVSVQIFTTLSSFSLMHEDVISIAFEKKTSLIIIPLHRRWSVHGYIESQDKDWRNVNRNILEKAPCSVAIFFNRGTPLRKGSARSSASNMSVCMIFFGGNDDREALVLAKRMLKESEVTLTVVHFVSKDHHDSKDSEDYMYDIVLINGIKEMAKTNECLDYKPYIVEDGPQTILMVRSLANEFDMFILGKRYGVPTPQLSGLSEWIEIPELGIVGDLFASKDLTTRASVLVVQQHKQLVRKQKN